MNQHIQDAIEKVRDNDFVSYFEILDPIVPTSKRAMFSQLRSRFNSDKFSSHFDQQLIVFAREVEKLVGDTSPTPHAPEINVGTGKLNIDTKRLKKLIAQGQTQPVLNELVDVLDTPQTQKLLDQVIVLGAALNGLSPMSMSNDEISRKKNQLNTELLGIINNIPS